MSRTEERKEREKEGRQLSTEERNNKAPLGNQALNLTPKGNNYGKFLIVFTQTQISLLQDLFFLYSKKNLLYFKPTRINDGLLPKAKQGDS